VPLKPKKRRIEVRYFLVLALAFSIIGLAESLGFLWGMNHFFYDLSQRWRGPRPFNPNIVLITVDENTLTRLGNWPIRREYYARLLDHLSPARVIGMDLVFSEPTSDDPELSRAVRNKDRLVLPMYVDSHLRVAVPMGSLAPVHLGHVHLELDADGIVRKVFQRIEYQGKSFPSFAAAIHRLIQFPDEVRAQGPEPDGGPTESTFLFQRESMLINYYGPAGTFPSISLAEVLENKWPPSFFQGKIVLIGVSAAGIEEPFTTPFTAQGRRMPGVEVHAHILNNVLDHSSIRPVAPWLCWVWLLAISSLGFLLFSRLEGMRGIQVWLLALGITAFLISQLLIHLHIWFPPAAFLLCLSAAFLCAYVFNLETMKQWLQKAQQDWEDSLNSIRDAIILRDRDCNVIRTNRAAREVLGPRVLDLLNSRCLSFQRPGISLFNRGKIGSDSGSGVEVVEEHFDPDLNRHLEIWSVARLDEKKEFAGLVQIIRDVSQRVETEKNQQRMQALLIQAQKMEAIGTLAGGIAHDFNNILTGMIGFTEIALFDLPEGHPANENLDRVLQGGERAKRMVQQILAFARQRKQEKSVVPVGLVVKEAMNLIRSTLPSNIEIQLEIASEGKIYGDPTQIHQIVMNLCTNAYHAMLESGGRLRMAVQDLPAVPEHERGGLSLGPYIRIQVSDTGFGMSREVTARIFEPYFTTKEKGMGTGLGLSVVHGIIKDFGGRITVESQPGRGTTFDILLPMAVEAEVNTPAESAAIPGGRERVLLVDDEQFLVESGKLILERLGYTVKTETSSLAALETFRQAPSQFDLIITDMTMPGLTGDKLSQSILAIRPDVSIILCTGFNETITEEKAKSIGIRELIYKPLALKDLAQVIRRVLDQRL
jgi:PAS domain S-box-containing protein